MQRRKIIDARKKRRRIKVKKRGKTWKGKGNGNHKRTVGSENAKLNYDFDWNQESNKEDG